jgi:PAT family beta-lactamase induction signal transducer AmpG
VTALGYGSYFLITVLSILPAMVLFGVLWPRFCHEQPGAKI